MTTSTAIHQTRPLCGLGRKTFTTGMVAKLCHVSPRTVTKWANKGTLPSYRLPGCLDRRVTRADLLTFLAAHGFTEALDRLRAANSVLLWGVSAPVAEALAGHYGVGELLRADCPAEAGALWERLAPPAAVLDLAGGGTEAGLTLGRWLAARAPRPAVLLLYPEDVTPRPVLGCKALRHPLGAGDVARVLAEAE